MYEPTELRSLSSLCGVKPGSKVTLSKDFDPAYKAGFVKKKKDGAQLLQYGVDLLADYQARLAAEERGAGLLAGVGRGRQGRHHPPRHERC
jgi:hypothetical protein